MLTAIRYLFSPGGSVKGCKVLVKSFKIGYFSYLVADREGFECSTVQIPDGDFESALFCFYLYLIF